MPSALSIKNRLEKEARRSAKKNGATFAGLAFVACGLSVLGTVAYFLIR